MAIQRFKPVSVKSPYTHYLLDHATPFRSTHVDYSFIRFILESDLFRDGPSSKSEELISLLVDDTCDASSFSFSRCSDPGPNPLDWPLLRSPVIKKDKVDDGKQQNYKAVTTFAVNLSQATQVKRSFCSRTQFF